MKNLTSINLSQEEIKKAPLFRAETFFCEICGAKVSQLNRVVFMSTDFLLCDSCLESHSKSLAVKSPLL